MAASGCPADLPSLAKGTKEDPSSRAQHRPGVVGQVDLPQRWEHGAGAVHPCWCPLLVCGLHYIIPFAFS
jgi:hypothetical protein